MREKMRNHLDKSTGVLFDIKQGIGGLVDIEFLAQYLVLANSAVNESLLKPGNNIAIFNELNNIDVLLEAEKKVLIESYERLLSLGHKATLQNDALLIEPSFFTQRESILKIWNKYFQV
jgi:glutamate-ammonia-ligase adenylyltransferase